MASAMACHKSGTVLAAAARSKAFGLENAISIEARSCRLDGVANACNLVGGKIVHDDDIARRQFGNENLADYSAAIWMRGARQSG